MTIVGSPALCLPVVVVLGMLDGRMRFVKQCLSVEADVVERVPRAGRLLSCAGGIVRADFHIVGMVGVAGHVLPAERERAVGPII